MDSSPPTQHFMMLHAPTGTKFLVIVTELQAPGGAREGGRY